MGARALPHQVNAGYFQMWIRGEFECSLELDLRHPSRLPQPVSPQSSTAGWWFRPQALGRRLNAPAPWEQGVFLQFLPYLASVPAELANVRSQLLDCKKEWTGNKLIFSQLAVPFFPFNLDQAQNKVTDVLLQQRWLYWRLPPWGGAGSFPKNCLCSVTGTSLETA